MTTPEQNVSSSPLTDREVMTVIAALAVYGEKANLAALSEKAQVICVRLGWLP